MYHVFNHLQDYIAPAIAIATQNLEVYTGQVAEIQLHSYRFPTGARYSSTTWHQPTQ